MFKNVYTDLTLDEIVIRDDNINLSDKLVKAGANRGYKDAMYVIGGTLFVGAILCDVYDLVSYKLTKRKSK